MQDSLQPVKTGTTQHTSQETYTVVSCSHATSTEDMLNRDLLHDVANCVNQWLSPVVTNPNPVPKDTALCTLADMYTAIVLLNCTSYYVYAHQAYKFKF
jgi:hypothetical protein